MEKWGSFNTLMDNATIHDLIRRTAGDLVASSYAIVLTGAGISTESGVADFRGPKEPVSKPFVPVKIETEDYEWG